MIVCSKRGPTIAFSLGCWLLLHTVLRFGACITLFFSPSDGCSWSALSKEPSEEVGTALVSDTGECAFFGLGLFAGIGLSVLYGRTTAVLWESGARRRREDRASMAGGSMVRYLLTGDAVLDRRWSSGTAKSRHVLALVFRGRR